MIILTYEDFPNCNGKILLPCFDQKKTNFLPRKWPQSGLMISSATIEDEAHENFDWGFGFQLLARVMMMMHK